MRIPEKTQAAIEDLLRTAESEHVIVAGFALSANPPAISNFGNCSDATDLRLYAELCKFVETKQKAGEAERIHIGRLN